MERALLAGVVLLDIHYYEYIIAIHVVWILAEFGSVAPSLRILQYGPDWLVRGSPQTCTSYIVVRYEDPEVRVLVGASPPHKEVFVLVPRLVYRRRTERCILNTGRGRMLCGAVRLCAGRGPLPCGCLLFTGRR